ncbi:MAG: Cell division protein FtsI [Anaerolineaceae bacterium 46_22]|jgi:cell division protein FtsI/penicillin-binding protein 2|nr:MAG: Cell division protein FtsI [Anaerolineaceae bacterium 46_22]
MKMPFHGRYLSIVIICAILGGAIVVQMVRINYTIYAQQLIAKSEDYQGIEKVIYPSRGNIYDRSGHILATNQVGYELGIDLKFVADPESIAFSVASIIDDMDYVNVYELANTEKRDVENRYFVLSSYVSKEKIDELARLKENYSERRQEQKSSKPSLSGLVWYPMQQRTYPEGTLAANILGFYNYFSRETAQGVYGIEEAYNRLLTGKPQSVFMPNDPYLVEALPDIQPGASLVLTIDREIQSMVERTLSDAIEWSGAEGGTIIVADPKTGEILGMASTPYFNPNEYWKYEETFPGITPYNRAIGTTYEPGSVFKVITMAAALDSGVAEPSTTYNDSSGVYWVANSWPIYNWDGGAWGVQDMTGCMQHSLNVCLAHVAVDLLQEDLFYQYLQAFGFGRSTGIDLASEANYPLRLPTNNQWVEIDLATNSFGQGIAVTPIQMVTAISAVANDGMMMTPHVVRSVIDRGQQYDVTPQVINSPISPETAHTLSQMLTIALQEEASDALIEGYTIAGKTGTGEIPTEFGYTSELTNASFVGWGPSDDPQFLVYVWLEKPTISKWGSVVAAPVFRDVVEQLVVLMRIPPDNIRLGTANE